MSYVHVHIGDASVGGSVGLELQLGAQAELSWELNFSFNRCQSVHTHTPPPSPAHPRFTPVCPSIFEPHDECGMVYSFAWYGMVSHSQGWAEFTSCHAAPSEGAKPAGILTHADTTTPHPLSVPVRGLGALVCRQRAHGQRHELLGIFRRQTGRVRHLQGASGRQGARARRGGVFELDSGPRARAAGLDALILLRHYLMGGSSSSVEGPGPIRDRAQL
jgi:hypothetical protein